MSGRRLRCLVGAVKDGAALQGEHVHVEVGGEALDDGVVIAGCTRGFYADEAFAGIPEGAGQVMKTFGLPSDGRLVIPEGGFRDRYTLGTVSKKLGRSP